MVVLALLCCARHLQCYSLHQVVVKELVMIAATTITPETVMELMMWNLARMVICVADWVG